MFERAVLIGVSPNIGWDDWRLTLKLLLHPSEWYIGIWVGKVEDWFHDYFRIKHAVSFDSARSALYILLTSLELDKGSEILLQAFTCTAVPNAILASGYMPVYTDIDATLNLDASDAQAKLSKKTRALIIQHTFGVPANMEKVYSFCKNNNLILIEDCAHSLSATFKGKLVGTFGKAAIFSFGRDKLISSVCGGMLITDDSILYQKIKKRQSELPYPSRILIIRRLLHPLITLPAMYIYTYFNLGKFLIAICRASGLITHPVSDDESRGVMSLREIKKFPDALAQMAFHQLEKLQAMNVRRKHITDSYFKAIKGVKLPSKTTGAVYLRFNLLSSRADELRFKAKQRGILLGAWYSHIIDPKSVAYKSVRYEVGSCPHAEKAAKESVNLPTYSLLTDRQITEVIKLISV